MGNDQAINFTGYGRNNAQKISDSNSATHSIPKLAIQIDSQCGKIGYFLAGNFQIPQNTVKERKRIAAKCAQLNPYTNQPDCKIPHAEIVKVLDKIDPSEYPILLDSQNRVLEYEGYADLKIELKLDKNKNKPINQINNQTSDNINLLTLEAYLEKDNERLMGFSANRFPGNGLYLETISSTSSNSNNTKNKLYAFESPVDLFSLGQILEKDNSFAALTAFKESISKLNQSIALQIPDPLTSGPYASILLSLNTNPREMEKIPVLVRYMFLYAKNKSVFKKIQNNELSFYEAREKKIAEIYPVSAKVASKVLRISDDNISAKFNKTKEKLILKNFSNVLGKWNFQTRPLSFRGVERFAAEEMPLFHENNICLITEDAIQSLFYKSNPACIEFIESKENVFTAKISVDNATENDTQKIINKVLRKEKMTRLENGHWISFEKTNLSNIIEDIQSTGAKPDKNGNFGKLDFADALSLSLEWRTKEHGKISDFIKQLQMPLPDTLNKPMKGFHATLRDYQVQGSMFLHRLHTVRKGGILADDMGLGKTVQTLAFLWRTYTLSKKSSFLGIVPLAAIPVWEREIQKFCPKLPVYVHHGIGRKLTKAKPGITLTTYQTFHRDISHFEQYSYTSIFCDEAQIIKNPSTRASLALRKIHSGSRFCLTGTPIENQTEDIWALMDFIFPGYLGAQEKFRRKYENASGMQLNSLKRKIAPFILRRTKSSVLTELPEITETIIPIRMLEKQKALYQYYLKEATDAIEASSTTMDYLVWLTRLRRIACHPEISDSETSDPLLSGKLSYLNDVLDELYTSSTGVLIFSQFTDMLNLTERLLLSRGHQVFRLDGKTPLKKRERMVQQFQNGQRHFFLISLKAGGYSLTLHRADTVVHLDPWWNPAVERQATDRVHRIGQTEHVNVYKLVTDETIEEKVIKLQDKKREIFSALFNGNEIPGAKGLTAEEIMLLLKNEEPLAKKTKTPKETKPIPKQKKPPKRITND